MALARHPSLVVDCADPAALARFWAAVLDWEVREDADDAGSWFEVRGEGQCLCFQRVDDYRAPEWPGQVSPQQMHLDVVVDDLDQAEAEAVALGASRHPHQPGTTFRVLLDPAGHPFCLCLS